MTALPRKVRLLSQDISVGVAREDIIIEEKPDDEGHVHSYQALGKYDSIPNTITLDRNLSPDKQRMVFIHENLHAMFDLSNLDSVFGAHSSGLDEHVCATMAPVLLSWMRENPRAVAYLMERS